ncbi:NUMOD3 domain-containing DNA-binding protein [uncultured Pedobacter sp.]
MSPATRRLLSKTRTGQNNNWFC